MIASTIWADFVRYVTLVKHTALTAELLSKERGASFCSSVLLVLFKRCLSEAYRNIHWCKYAVEMLCWPLRVWADGALRQPFPDVFLHCFTPTSPAEIPYCSCLGTGVTISNVVTIAEQRNAKPPTMFVWVEPLISSEHFLIGVNLHDILEGLAHCD